MPVRLQSSSSIGAGQFFARINYDSINLMPGEFYRGRTGNTWYGMQVDANIDVSYSKAVVISFEDFDGNTWNNPLLLDYKNLYEGKILA